MLPALALLLMPCLMSCAVGVTTRSLFGETMDLHIHVDSVANNEYPLAMTMLYVYDDELFNKLLGLSAKQWYDTETQIKDQESSKLEAYDWEWIPGQDTTVSLPLRSSTAGAIIFANYFNDGQHRVRVEPNRDIKVEMGFDDLKVEPVP
jgi:hypothetical protein